MYKLASLRSLKINECIVHTTHRVPILASAKENALYRVKENEGKMISKKENSKHESGNEQCAITAAFSKLF